MHVRFNLFCYLQTTAHVKVGINISEKEQLISPEWLLLGYPDHG